LLRGYSGQPLELSMSIKTPTILPETPTVLELNRKRHSFAIYLYSHLHAFRAPVPLHSNTYHRERYHDITLLAFVRDASVVFTSSRLVVSVLSA
jgi:hypothetical protein